MPKEEKNMAEWTEKELEELLAKMTNKAMTDMEFRREVLADATAALEKLAGKPLPEGASLKCIERDPNYQSTFVLPDLIDEERLDEESLSKVAGGISALLIVSVCGHAVGVGPDVGACYKRVCWDNFCAAEACGDHSCVGYKCFANKGTPQFEYELGDYCTHHTGTEVKKGH